MKTKYVVVLTVELNERITKKQVREWMVDALVSDPRHVQKYLPAMPYLTKLRVRSVDED